MAAHEFLSLRRRLFAFCAGGNPDLRKAAGLGINRKTWSWNAAAAVFAYGYGTLAELQYKYVGQDQLIGGTWSVPQTLSFPLAISLRSLLPPLSPPRWLRLLTVRGGCACRPDNEPAVSCMDWQTGEVRSHTTRTHFLGRLESAQVELTCDGCGGLRSTRNTG